MLRTLRSSVTTSHTSQLLSKPTIRTAATAAAAQKREGDISDAFASLSGLKFGPLSPKYAAIKRDLIKGREDAVQDSWTRLLKQLENEIAVVREKGSNVIPEIKFGNVEKPSEEFMKSYKSTGVAVVRGAVSEKEALQWKADLKKYIKDNPQTKAFPPNRPQVFELYWSPTQLRARGHPSLLSTQRALMSPWHASPSTPHSTSHPTSYADRLRIRLPGDTTFALGPHIDGGSVERWDPAGYGGRSGVYASIFRGAWESFDPWDATGRVDAAMDLHRGVGACSFFRMSQGWLSLSNAGAGEGTLLVNPLLGRAMAYVLLRPFFAARRPREAFSAGAEGEEEFLAEGNWGMAPEGDAWMQGATEGRGQELNAELHPHLRLADSMVHVPRVRPGDYVAWHCDTIHAVDSVHQGTEDSSVLYIPACPLTDGNARGLKRQRECFEKGEPSPDFGGGIGEGEHRGRVTKEVFERMVDVEGRSAMGAGRWVGGHTHGEREVVSRANAILGF